MELAHRRMGWTAPVGYKAIASFDLIVGLVLGMRGVKFNYELKTHEEKMNHVTELISSALVLPAAALLVGWVLKLL